MRTLLDTTVVSQRIKPVPLPSVLHWWQKQPAEELYLSALTIHELRYGFELLQPGKRRRVFEGWLRDTVLPEFEGRILSVDATVADQAGRLLAAAKGHGIGVADALIAATAVIHELQVATLNWKHFERLGVELVEW